MYMGREFITAHGERKNNHGFKYSMSDVNLYMVVMKKDKSDTKIYIFLFVTFQPISSCNIVQHQKFIHNCLILFETYNRTNTPTRLYHVLFHSLIQRKYMLQLFTIYNVMLFKVKT